MAGLYIHIPFCASRCIYCGFYSTTRADVQDKYVDALCSEMKLRAKVDGCANQISTIYLGGGTPSQLSRRNLERIFSNIYNVYDVAQDAEITMECNPDDVSPNLLTNLPINRVSMGIQTFSDERLRFLHRRHSASQAIEAVDTLRKSGINNISIDLMFGFPGESLTDWTSDINKALELKPEHISAYSLMYEEGTALGRMLENGEVSEIDEELSLKMYEVLIDMLTSAGYDHYEISNFAKQKSDGTSFRSRHNSSYWHDIPYIGIGAAAHSYIGGNRSWNVANLSEYINSISNGKQPLEIEYIDDDTHYDDIITTALRTKEGIDISELKPKYQKYLLTEAERYIQQGLLIIKENHLSLTRKGLFISDMIMSELMYTSNSK